MKNIKDFLIENLDGSDKLLKPIEVKQFMKACLNTIIIDKDKSLAQNTIFDVSKFNTSRKKFSGTDEIYNYYATINIKSNKDFYFDCRIDAENEDFITLIYTFYNAKNSNNSIALFAFELPYTEFLNSLKIKRSPKIDYMLTIGKGMWSEYQGKEMCTYFQDKIIDNLK